MSSPSTAASRLANGLQGLAGLNMSPLENVDSAYETYRRNRDSGVSTSTRGELARKRAIEDEESYKAHSLLTRSIAGSQSVVKVANAAVGLRGKFDDLQLLAIETFGALYICQAEVASLCEIAGFTPPPRVTDVRTDRTRPARELLPEATSVLIDFANKLRELNPTLRLALQYQRAAAEVSQSIETHLTTPQLTDEVITKVLAELPYSEI